MWKEREEEKFESLESLESGGILGVKFEFRRLGGGGGIEKGSEGS